MGYDMSITVFKKKILEKLINELNNNEQRYRFSDIYSNCLFAYLLPEEYDIPKDEEGRYICSGSHNIFKDFFTNHIENDDAFIISKSTYFQMVQWLEDKLKSIRIYDLLDGKYNENEIESLMRVYKSMKEENVNFKEEFVVYEHNW